MTFKAKKVSLGNLVWHPGYCRLLNLTDCCVKAMIDFKVQYSKKSVCKVGGLGGTVRDLVLPNLHTRCYWNRMGAC